MIYKHKLQHKACPISIWRQESLRVGHSLDPSTGMSGCQIRSRVHGSRRHAEVANMGYVEFLTRTLVWQSQSWCCVERYCWELGAVYWFWWSEQHRSATFMYWLASHGKRKGFASLCATHTYMPLISALGCDESLSLKSCSGDEIWMRASDLVLRLNSSLSLKAFCNFWQGDI